MIPDLKRLKEATAHASIVQTPAGKELGCIVIVEQATLHSLIERLEEAEEVIRSAQNGLEGEGLGTDWINDYFSKWRGEEKK